MPSLLTRTIWSNGYMQIVQCSFARCLLWYHLEYGDTQPFSILLLWYRKSNLLDLVNSQFRKWWTLSYNKYFRKGFSGWENKVICDFFKDTSFVYLYSVSSICISGERTSFVWPKMKVVCFCSMHFSFQHTFGSFILTARTKATQACKGTPIYTRRDLIGRESNSRSIRLQCCVQPRWTWPLIVNKKALHS